MGKVPIASRNARVQLPNTFVKARHGGGWRRSLQGLTGQPVKLKGRFQIQGNLVSQKDTVKNSGKHLVSTSGLHTGEGERAFPHHTRAHTHAHVHTLHAHHTHTNTYTHPICTTKVKAPQVSENPTLRR